VPSLILLIIALPVLVTFFKMDGEIAPTLSLKLVGSTQWYWTYEYMDSPNLEVGGVWGVIDTDGTVI
jgi:heme/copper-type cytochrome/quinol oxidase subunit 2